MSDLCGSRPRNIAALRPQACIPNYTARWQRQVCVWTTCLGLLRKARRPVVEPATRWEHWRAPRRRLQLRVHFD